MRVATRRQRAAWRVFGDAYDDKRLRGGHREPACARWQRRLGTVRDLDVLHRGTLDDYRENRSPRTERTALGPLPATAGAIAATRHVGCSSKGARQPQATWDWLDDYRDFVQTEGRWDTRQSWPTVPHRVRDTMPSRSGPRTRASAGTSRSSAGPTSRRSMSCASAASGCATRWSSSREALGPDATAAHRQGRGPPGHLGLLQDADVAAGLARQFLVDHAGTLDDVESAAIGRYLVDREREPRDCAGPSARSGGAWPG